VEEEEEEEGEEEVEAEEVVAWQRCKSSRLLVGGGIRQRKLNPAFEEAACYVFKMKQVRFEWLPPPKNSKRDCAFHGASWCSHLMSLFLQLQGSCSRG
jgi:hypothetical protein